MGVVTRVAESTLSQIRWMGREEVEEEEDEAVAVAEVAAEVVARSGAGVEARGVGEGVALVVRKVEDGRPKVKAGGEGGAAVAATPLMAPERATPATKRRSANGKGESGSGSGEGMPGGRRKQDSSRRRRERRRGRGRGRGSSRNMKIVVGCSRTSQTAAALPWRAAVPPSRPLLSPSERQQSSFSAPSSPGREQSPSGLRRPRPSVDPPLSSTRKLWRLP